ncbi:dihydroceramide fatty acyl 2-hydroxylase FAH1-like [Olea europaea subsp. europaea]|uniref:Dihydroceramide fatty acyl 2-hydroxylase FAH1-like n=1 Tax=Olea europaea subsp. europaea TaxID=158383 RepID=A0A8S0PHC1_OLEEU|nr:dihydroceramide fatty acyl 2-hydroxylase FAH1-like [Olea europaea subsp. europaea]
MELTVPQVALVMAVGIFTWTMLEYTMHHSLFHIKTNNYWGNTIHYLLHGCHHKHPMDGLHLFFPPAVTAILLVPVWNLTKFIATPTAPGIFGGSLLGYVVYNVTHCYLHHGQPTVWITPMASKLNGTSGIDWFLLPGLYNLGSNHLL